MIFLLSLASNASSQNLGFDQQGWIIGGKVGGTKLLIKPEEGLKSSKVNAVIYSVLGGYNFNNWLGLEFDISRSANFKDEHFKLDGYVYGASFTPKFTYHFNDNLGGYFMYGLQYTKYKQKMNLLYFDEVTWDSVDPFFGAGLQYNFSSSLRAGFDYKYSKLKMERVVGPTGPDFSVNKVNLNMNVLTFTLNYQF